MDFVLIYSYHSFPVDITALRILRLAITPASEDYANALALETLLLVMRGGSSGLERSEVI